MNSVITPELKSILTAQICPYCGDKPEYVDSSAVYKRSYGMIYLCRLCDAYVGVHKGTSNSLGRLANAALRQYKMEAHAAFDPIWREEIQKGLSKYEARTRLMHGCQT